MRTATLSDVTLKTLENYRHAAEHAVEAYRAGGHKLVAAVSGGFASRLDARAGRLGERLARVRGRLAGLADDGIDRVSAQTAKAIEATSTAAATGIARAAERVASIDNPLLANGLKAAARVSLAGAQVALSVSARLADGAVALSAVAGGRRLGAKAGRKTAGRAQRAAVGASRKARALRQAPVAKKAKAVKAAVAAPQRAPRRAKAAAAAA